VTHEDAPRRLRALPTQLIERDGAIRLRRGCVEVRISGERAAEIVQRVFSVTQHRPAAVDEICEAFAAPDRAAALDLLGELAERRILVDEDDPGAPADEAEGPLRIFYWHFGETSESVRDRLSEQRIAVVGVNVVSRELLRCLAASGVTDLDVVDDPLLRNQSLFPDGRLEAGDWTADGAPVPGEEWRPDQVGCVVATSDFGGGESMRRWNAFCLDRGCQLLPVVLQDLIGYVGPLVVPGETACFECMTQRWNSNLGGSESRWEVHGFDGQDVVGFHPALATTLGAVAAFELTKFYGIRMPFSVVGRLIEINLMTMEMNSHKVLKVPRCPSCSPLNARAATGLTKSWFGFAQNER
jgi:bacteriocin biosynthesis cyclodehydratase domain-containing protein